ncbi:MAG: hypothetical protein JWN68_3107 [Nocardioides sp.]|jgi:hypothetical protein|uniref:hypothetical protein n=1 Tax=Nocardioides sp. TaxID=35761 RepID=UPI00261051A5|nr:hypothetical protein [Nocardioides sp.]MCW2835154.1 hypothetical protein [Nocardioides sp.]
MRTPPPAISLFLGALVATMTPAVVAGTVVSSSAATTVQASTAASSVAQLPSARRARGGSLSTSPGTYVGGQAITFTGSLGVSGVRRIGLQLHMNRPGDSWFAVRGFSGKTAANGGFRFDFPAPAMFGIRYRVTAGQIATPPVTFNAKAQDLTMWVAGEDPSRESDPGQPVAGVPFTIAVDTTPSLFRRPETIGLPVFERRGLTLQRRLTGDSWETLGRSSVGADGLGYFPGVTAPAGTAVYRVVQDEISSGANRIGWMQTFPTYVTVLDQAPSQPKTRTSAEPRVLQSTSRTALTGTGFRRASSGASATAASRYGWYPTLWDYTWEAGQSLTSPADAGSDRDGWWQEYADGAGRVSRQNGGLYLDSQRNNGGGQGDFGTTRATLRDSALAYGRWETRIRLKSAESNAADFTVLVELVPDRPEDYACGRRNITLAEVHPSSSTLRFGAKADNRQWSATRTIPSLVNTSPAVAVEVAKGHITWFWDARPIGTVRSRAAVSDVPMTLRFSLVGDQTTEYNQTGLVSDWQRGFALGRGKQVANGPRLTSSALTACEG